MHHCKWQKKIMKILIKDNSLLETASLPRAWGPRQRPINPRQRLCRGRPSAKSSRGILSRRRGSLPRALYRALGKAFAEGWSGTRQRKAAVTAPAPGTESLPRAVSGGPRQRIILFFEKSLPRASNHGPRQTNVQNFSKKSLPRAMGRPSAKNYSFFFWKIFAEGFPAGPRQRNFKFFLKKSLPRASNHGPRQRNVPEFFQWIFAEDNGMALDKGPFFAEGLGHCPRQRGRNLKKNLFFVFHRHKHFIYIHTYIYIYIYLSTITYIYHTEPIFSRYITTIIVNHKSQYITTTTLHIVLSSTSVQNSGEK